MKLALVVIVDADIVPTLVDFLRSLGVTETKPTFPVIDELNAKLSEVEEQVRRWTGAS